MKKKMKIFDTLPGIKVIFNENRKNPIGNNDTPITYLSIQEWERNQVKYFV